MEYTTVKIVELVIQIVSKQGDHSVRAARERDQVDDRGLNDLHRRINLLYAPYFVSSTTILNTV